MIKRITTSFLSVLLTFVGLSYATILPVQAANTSLGFTVSPNPVVTNNDITVNVTLSTTVDTNAVGLEINYDKTKLDYTGLDEGGSVYPQALYSNIDEGQGKLSFERGYNGSYKGQGTLIKLHFKAIAGSGAANLTWGSGTTVLYSGSSVPTDKNNGSVQINPPAPVITSFSASPSSVAPNGKVKFTWAIQAGTTISKIILNPGNKEVTGTEHELNVTQSDDYKLRVEGPGGSDEKTIRITVFGPPEIKSFSAESGTITAGGQTTLRWDTANVTSVNITGLGNVGNSGSQVIKPTGTTKFILTATGNGGTKTAEVTVTVNPAPAEPGAPTIKKYEVTPNAIKKGDGATLKWDIDGADEVTIDNVKVGIDGERSVKPLSTTRYNLVAKKGSKQTAQSITLTVVDPVVASVPVVSSTPVAKASTTPAATATPTTGVDPTQSSVIPSKTTANADGVDTVTITVTLRNGKGEVIKDITPTLSGLRDSGDVASPFVKTLDGESWETQVSSTLPGLVSVTVNAGDVVVSTQDLTFNDPVVSASPEPTSNSGSSFGMLLAIGFLVLLLLLLLLIFIWRKLRNRNEEEEVVEDLSTEAYPGEATGDEFTPVTQDSPAQPATAPVPPAIPMAEPAPSSVPPVEQPAAPQVDPNALPPQDPNQPPQQPVQ